MATDVYALASTVFTLLSGRPPFLLGGEQDNVFAVLGRIARQPPPDLRARGVPDAVCAALERGLAKQAQDRPATALELGRALQWAQWRSGIPVSPLTHDSEEVHGDGGG